MTTRPLYLVGPGGKMVYGHDFNKNVTEIFSPEVAGEQALIVTCDYTPYGSINYAEGDLGMNPFYFSSEYLDTELGLIYYNYRHYNPSNGKWISRDPIEEDGDSNLYLFTRNAPIIHFDYIGADCTKWFTGGCTHGYPPSIPPIPIIPEPAKENEDNNFCPPNSKKRRVTGQNALFYNLNKHQSCLNGEEYRTNNPKEGYEPIPNGCGPERIWYSEYIPNHFYLFNFTEACNNHDICYGTCGSNKDDCDSTFRRQLLWECVSSMNFLTIPSCTAFAQIYYSAVSGLGKDAYESAQDDACEWQICCKETNFDK